MSKDFVEALDKLSIVAKSEELKQSINVACQLHESFAAKQEIAVSENVDESNSTITSKEVQLAQQLKNSITVLQVLILDHVPQLAPVMGDQVLQHVAKVTIQLQNNLAAVIAATHVAVQKVDFTNFETEQEILTKPTTVDESTIMAGQEEKLTALDKIITLDDELVLEEQAKKTALQPVALLDTKLEKAIGLEMESQVYEDIAVVFEQTAVVGMKQAMDETISAESVAVTKMETMTLDSKILVPTETVVSTEQKDAIDEIKSAVDHDDKEKEIIIALKSEDILQESVNLESPNNEVTSNTISEDRAKNLAKSDKTVGASGSTIGKFVFFKLLLDINQVKLTT